MRNQDIPPYYQMLKLGLGFGGIFHVLCSPAIARSSTPEPTLPQVDTESESAFKTNAQEFQQATPVGPQPDHRTLPAEIVLTSKPTFSNTATESSSDRLLFSKRGFHQTDTKRTGKIASWESTPWQTDSGTEAAIEHDSAVDTITGVGTHTTENVQHLELSWSEAGSANSVNWLNQLSSAVSEDPLSPVDMLEVAASEPGFSPAVTTATTSLSQRSTSQNLETQNLETQGPNLSEPAETIATLPSAAISAAKKETAEVGLIRAAEDANSESTASLGSKESSTNTTTGIRNNRPDLLSEILADEEVVSETFPTLDDELGTLRLIQLRARENEDLGVLRLLQTAESVPEPPKPPVAFVSGRLGFVDLDNVFRSPESRMSEQIYQSGLAVYFLPKISQDTSLYAIAETNLARYNNISEVNYNEVQLQIGIKQRLLRNTFAQIGWRNQRLYSPGYRDQVFGVQYIDALVSHRQILTPKVWIDGFYQARLGFADPSRSSRFRQTFTASFNYGISRDLRTSVLYQLDFDDYTQIPRFDTYQQVLGVVSYRITPEARVTVFGGTRFGRSSDSAIDLDDTFYGAGLNVTVPLF